MFASDVGDLFDYLGSTYKEGEQNTPKVGDNICPECKLPQQAFDPKGLRCLCDSRRDFGDDDELGKPLTQEIAFTMEMREAIVAECDECKY